VFRRHAPDPPRPGDLPGLLAWLDTDLLGLLGAVPLESLARTPARGECYVYGLDEADGTCFYIGQSASLLTRLGVWQTVYGKRIAGIRVLRVRDAHDMDVTENFLIKRMQPEWNINGTDEEERRRRAKARKAPRPRSPGTYDRDQAPAWVRARARAAS
jgi:hypothetical protein